MVTICDRNSDEMFFLTRDGDIEITSFGFPDRGQKGIAHYEQQYIHAYSKEELDVYGRNYTDRLFIRFCAVVFDIVLREEITKFRLLSCKKDGDRYIARLELTDEILEMELGEMVTELEQRVINSIKQHIRKSLLDLTPVPPRIIITKRLI